MRSLVSINTSKLKIFLDNPEDLLKKLLKIQIAIASGTLKLGLRNTFRSRWYFSS
ncbi:hypothetical protein HC931_13055 [Candidatus Gracilibacteria bacterium]|jgi:hypothetical protein|nr:hypothetical protein [Candidatus Gracilibacteria bacterium]NJM88812.1 hypothetical protein [Hydrococcus sp. RU_2_2]NJP19353.1 hypothetical protein [Hydrococcus sp. CRU_1_1]